MFPSKTKYVPSDDLAFTGPPTLFDRDFDEVHVSCTFTWDREKAERLADNWRVACNSVKLGGPAFNSPVGDFTPGLYVAHGYVITSRGCPRKCPFCLVPNREGKLRELPIHVGQHVFDNNLLACSDGHVSRVFDMLETQRGVTLTGGLDTGFLKDWHIDRLARLGTRLKYFYIAYDLPSDKESTEDAMRRFHEAGIPQHKIGCYVLVGYQGDTVAAADERCEWVFCQGGVPFAMYFRADGDERKKPSEWGKLCTKWGPVHNVFNHMKQNGPKYHSGFVRGRFAEKHR